MRVNHVGEVCAQALYSAQALATADPALRRQFERAAGEETDHLAWTAERLAELGRTARACSIRSGMPAPSASACWRLEPAMRRASAS